jgi:hypothetical protein
MYFGIVEVLPPQRVYRTSGQPELFQPQQPDHNLGYFGLLSSSSCRLSILS